jgi:hypothetical protein
MLTGDTICNMSGLSPFTRQFNYYLMIKPPLMEIKKKRQFSKGDNILLRYG